MNGEKVAYVRVSTYEQNEERQIQEIKNTYPDIEKFFTDKVSGSSLKRPELEKLLDYVRDGDKIYVHSMDRLARNLDDLRKIVREVTQKGIDIIFVKENLSFYKDKKDSMSELLLNMMGAFAEFERSLIKERQREGIEIAKKKGKYKGRKPSLSELQKEEIRKRVSENSKINKTKLAEKYGVSRETLYRVIAAKD